MNFFFLATKNILFVGLRSVFKVAKAPITLMQLCFIIIVLLVDNIDISYLS